MLSAEIEDLDMSIFHFTQSRLLPPRLWFEHGQLILQALFLLASALFRGSQLSQQPQDAIFTAQYLRHLLEQPLHPSVVSRPLVMTILVGVLGVQINLKAGNAMQSIGEMAVHCSELLTSDGSNVDKFLASLSFDTLRSAASSGPVVIINHSSWRSDS